MSDMPKGTGSPEYDNAKRLIMKEYERLKYERLKKENERLREALEKIANDEMLDIIAATDIAVQALEGEATMSDRKMSVDGRISDGRNKS